MSTYQLQNDFDSQHSLTNSRSTERKYGQEKGIPSSYQYDHSPYMKSHDNVHQSHDRVNSSHESLRSHEYRSSPVHDNRGSNFSHKDNDRLDGSPSYSAYSGTTSSSVTYPYTGREMASSPSPRFEVRVSPLNNNNSSSPQYRNSPERVSPNTRRGYSPDTGYQAAESHNKQRYGVDKSARHSPSPYKEWPTATQTYYYSDERATPTPEPAESRLVFSGPLPNQFNYAQSRPAGDSPTSSPRNSAYKPVYSDTRSESPGQYSPQPQYRDQVKASPQPMRSPAHSNQPIKSPAPPPAPKPQPIKLQEDEVDALTNLLMQNMEAAADPEFFGQCADCGKAILGEDNACLAMDQLFHTECFTCVDCGTSLKGSHFYAMEEKLYCESCYMNTLEKCSVCSEAIKDKIVRATGRPYHSQCFVCVVCQQNMEGVPFTVDSANQVHCIQDFHRKFAPRCCVCELPIMPKEGEEEAVRVVALDRSFHMACYKCEDCGVVLSSESEGRGCYPLDEHILCKACNAHRIQKLTSKMTTEL